jgi:hypothetical protein
MSALTVEHYLQRARDFFLGMHLVRDADAYRNSAALLAIHSAVSFSDALRTGLGDVRLASDNHDQAADSLRRLLVPKRVELGNGLNHLKNLLASKSGVAYGNERLSDNELRKLILGAERFSAWANDMGKLLGLEGWTDDNG